MRRDASGNNCRREEKGRDDGGSANTSVTSWLSPRFRLATTIGHPRPPSAALGPPHPTRSRTPSQQINRRACLQSHGSETVRDERARAFLLESSSRRQSKHRAGGATSGHRWAKNRVSFGRWRGTGVRMGSDYARASLPRTVDRVTPNLGGSLPLSIAASRLERALALLALSARSSRGPSENDVKPAPRPADRIFVISISLLNGSLGGGPAGAAAAD
ncbi:hypothetical protein KM043_001413 [Ampulex compressa]|nr:hypothetical protein KM043_001413 [Ampulex compressa]